MWTSRDISRLNRQARELLQEGHSPGEVSGIVGSDVFILAQLILLAREDFQNGDRWQQLMSQYRAECGMPPKQEKHPLAWLLSTGVKVTLNGSRIHLEPPEGFQADRWRRCVEYARAHKAELLVALVAA